MKFIILSLFLFTTSSYAQEALNTNSFKDIENKALELGKKHGNKNVLVAIDIDNTLLTMPQSLGSDQWFNWQYKNCFSGKKQPDFCTAKDLGGFFDLVGKIFAVSNMTPSEKNIPTIVKNLQAKGFKVILLTSRGHDYRNATQRVVKSNGMDFRKSAIGPDGGFPSTYKPYNMKNLKAAGITKEESVVAKLKKPRSVSYMNGIFMGAGQHKGIMLKSLLHKTNTTVKAIVFADDHEKHTKRMQQIFSSKKNIHAATFRYGKIDPMVKAFDESDKKDAIKEYNTFKQSLNSVFK